MTGAEGREAPKPLNVLIIEDCAEDAELIVFELRRAGYSPVYRRVESADEMALALGGRGISSSAITPCRISRPPQRSI